MSQHTGSNKEKIDQMLKMAHKIEGYLKTAASFGHVGVIKSLSSMPEAKLIFKKSIEVDGEVIQYQSFEDFSVLGVAVVENQNQAVKMLLDAGIDQYSGFPNFGTAMHLAVMQGNPEVVELLLRQDLGGVDRKNEKNETPLHICI